MKCPFCGSEESIVVDRDHITRKTEKITKQGMCTCTEQSHYIGYMNKHLCLGCGMVYQCMSEEDLKKYHKEKQYFKQ